MTGRERGGLGDVRTEGIQRIHVHSYVVVLRRCSGEISYCKETFGAARHKQIFVWTEGDSHARASAPVAHNQLQACVVDVEHGSLLLLREALQTCRVVGCIAETVVRLVIDHDTIVQGVRHLGIPLCQLAYVVCHLGYSESGGSPLGGTERICVCIYLVVVEQDF